MLPRKFLLITLKFFDRHFPEIIGFRYRGREARLTLLRWRGNVINLLTIFWVVVMSWLRRILTRAALVAATALGLTVSVNTDSLAQRGLDEEAERACERALALGTIEAIEDYLFNYPNAPTACKVLAMNALSPFGPNPGGPGTPGPNPGYGG